MLKDIVSVIQCDMTNSCFIQKHPIENFNTGTQLIVHESQEAIFFMNGQALDSFGAGRHTLTTQNMPIVNKFFNRISGDTTPFHCEVYFINKTEQMAIKWGTSSKMEFMEPTYGFPIQLGACGEMTLKVANARQLLIKVVGTEKELSQNQLVDKLRSFLLLRLKNYIVSFIKEEKINIFEIDECLERISEAITLKLKNDFIDYGMSLEKFLVTTIIKPEDDKNYLRYKDLHFRQYADIAEAKIRQQVGVIEQQTKAQQMVIEAEGIARKRTLEGYTYQEERQFDVANRFAENEATGQLANIGIGMGMVTGLSGTLGKNIGTIVNNTFEEPKTQSKIKCVNCGNELSINSKFCPECGQKNIQDLPTTMLCPQCGQSITRGKFCSECGCNLEKLTCVNCGTELKPNVKFCPECGQKTN